MVTLGTYKPKTALASATLAMVIAAALCIGGFCTGIAYATPALTHTVSIATKNATYDIVFKLNGGKQAKGQTTVISKGSSIKTSNLKKPTRHHFRFVGWYSNRALTTKAKVVKGTRRATKRTVYAKWKRTSYGIIYSMNGGLFKGTYRKSIGIGKTLAVKNLVVPVRDGYTFGGWYTDKNLKSKAKSLRGVARSSDRTVFAKWIANSYAIEYEPNGGTMPADAPRTYVSSRGISALPMPTRPGYSFIGWYTDSDLTSLATRIAPNDFGDKKLYARWEKRITVAQLGYRAQGATPNSLEAFRAAADNGYTSVSAQVAFTADGKAMVGTSEFAAFLGTCHECGLTPYLEIPAGTQMQVEDLVQAVDGYDFAQDARWISPNSDVLDFVQLIHPRSNLILRSSGVTEDAVRKASIFQARGSRVAIGADMAEADEQAVSRCRDNGIPLAVWTSSKAPASNLDQYVSTIIVAA